MFFLQEKAFLTVASARRECLERGCAGAAIRPRSVRLTVCHSGANPAPAALPGTAARTDGRTDRQREGRSGKESLILTPLPGQLQRKGPAVGGGWRGWVAAGGGGWGGVQEPISPWG